MAGDVEQRLGSLTVFTCDDFEGDWRRVANGGFGQVFQARHKRWRTEYAIKCSPCLLPDATRYLPAPPLSFYRGKTEGWELLREGPSRLRLRIVQYPELRSHSISVSVPEMQLAHHTCLWDLQRSQMSRN